ncbi:unnamed protein product, partial [Phaedon cochleariae]
MDDLESKRPPSPDSVRTKPTAREETETVIRSTLKEIMMSVDLDEVTSKTIRSKLEEELDMDLGEYKSFIDQEMLVILGQMDAPTEIFEHVYLGSEWNASNYDELQKNRVGHILNVTREIDNFFPGTFDYLNVRVYDDEKTDLLKHWDDTYKYITKAKDKGSKVLVHCKMGVSRSASVVIAYAMKAYNWDFDTALRHVKEKRTCIKPNTSFLLQLETYQGILDAMKNREKLQRSKSETNLKSPGTGSEKTDKAVTSEPPPTVEPFADPAAHLSGQDLRQLGGRPKSWSPDNLRTRELKSTSPPLSVSLEDLNRKSPDDKSREGRAPAPPPANAPPLARHVLMPCDNGESYSVSPNQIVHLPGHDSGGAGGGGGETGRRRKLVLNLATRFEKAEEAKEETWDPGEEAEGKRKKCSMKEPESNTESDTCDSKDNSATCVWTSSTTLKTESAVPFSDSLVKVPEAARPRTACDPFSNQLDRVFDREEKRQNRTTISSSCPPDLTSRRESPSRQSSWSSCDSAIALGFPGSSASELSRHSSWGSGDAPRGAPPSRNSSWGSYDLRPRRRGRHGETPGGSEAGERSIWPYEKEEIPWHPGTVRRSKQKLEENSTGKTPSSETLLFDLIQEPAEAINPVLVAPCDHPIPSSAISDKIDIPVEEHKYSDSSRLSISAPEPSSMELVSQGSSLSRSASNVSTIDKGSSVKKHTSFLESLHSQDTGSNSKKNEDLLDTNGSGKVRNLKKEFEAKSSSKHKGTSLPSSPVSVHLPKADKLASDDVNLKNLIGLFENKESVVNLRQKSRPFAQNRNTRYSCIEVSPRIIQTPLIDSMAKKTTGSEEKRPPMVPVVRNASPCMVVAATVITAAKKKQQQYGKSHPLARLNIKPRHN